MASVQSKSITKLTFFTLPTLILLLRRLLGWRPEFKFAERFVGFETRNFVEEMEDVVGENGYKEYENKNKNAAAEKGRSIFKPSLGQTIQSLGDARANVSAELSQCEKDEIEKTLSFVLEELERWQWTKEWLSKSGKRS